jgi:hypothetical protein
MHVWRGSQAGVHERIDAIDHQLRASKSQHGIPAPTSLRYGGGKACKCEESYENHFVVVSRNGPSVVIRSGNRKWEQQK